MYNDNGEVWNIMAPVTLTKKQVTFLIQHVVVDGFISRPALVTHVELAASNEIGLEFMHFTDEHGKVTREGHVTHHKQRINFSEITFRRTHGTSGQCDLPQSVES